MKLKPVAAALFALCAATSASALSTVDLGAYTLSYDETTPFGYFSYSFSAGGDVTGFAWSVPTAVQVVSFGGAAATTNITLPSFTIAVNPGWALSAPVTGFLGNLVFNEVGGATTSATVAGAVSVNGGLALPAGGALDRTEITAVPGYTNGYYAGETGVPLGAFNTLAFSGGTLTLKASGGTFGSIVGQTQNELKISFLAAAVPEPQAALLLLAGLGVLVPLVRRRKA